MTETLSSRLRKRATVWASDISKTANATIGKPRHIRVRTSVSTSDYKLVIISTAISPKDDARAYEKGSGIHSKSNQKSRWQLGSRGKILITPKRKKVLAFHWDMVDSSTPRGPKFRGISKQTEKALFNYVEHPGVQAANGGKGYLGPAVDKVRARIRREVPAEIRAQVLGDFQRIFKKGKNK